MKRIVVMSAVVLGLLVQAAVSVAAPMPCGSDVTVDPSSLEATGHAHHAAHAEASAHDHHGMSDASANQEAGIPHDCCESMAASRCATVCVATAGSAAVAAGMLLKADPRRETRLRLLDSLQHYPTPASVIYRPPIS